MKIKKSSMVLFFQLFLFLIPVGFTADFYIGILWYLLLAGVIIVFILKELRKNHLTDMHLTFYMIAYLGSLVIATYLNNGNWLYSVATALIVCVFIYFVQNEVILNKERFVSVLSNVLLVNILIESIVHLLGVGHFLLSFASAYIYYAVWISIHWVSVCKSKKTDCQIYIVTTVIILVTVLNPQINSDGSKNYEWTFYTMSILACMAYFFRKSLYNWHDFFNVKSVYYIIVGFNLSAVVFQVFTTIPFVQFIVVEIMGKDITFTGRTEIWAFSMSFIKRKPWFGYGSGYTDLILSGDYWTNWLGIHGAHNQFLATALSGGVITLGLYLFFLWKSTIKLNRRSAEPESVAICVGLLVAFLQLSLTYRNIINCMPLFALLVLAYSTDLQEKSFRKRIKLL